MPLCGDVLRRCVVLRGDVLRRDGVLVVTCTIGCIFIPLLHSVVIEWGENRPTLFAKLINFLYLICVVITEQQNVSYKQNSSPGRQTQSRPRGVTSHHSTRRPEAHHGKASGESFA